MNKILAVIVLYSLAVTNAQSTCAIHFDEVRSKINLEMDWIRGASTSQGRPGKRGPLGGKGPKGDQGNRGLLGPKGNDHLSDINVLQQQIQRLETTVKQLKEEAVDQRIRDGWKKAANGYYYRLSSKVNSWQAGKTLCEEKRARLATVGPRDPSLKKYLWSLIPTGGSAWIGFNDIEIQGQWVWIDGITSDLASTFWATGQPDSTRQDCGALHKTFDGIDDMTCNGKYLLSLCELDPLPFES